MGWNVISERELIHSIHELDVGVMNGCLQPYVPDFVMARLFICSVNCNKMFQHVQNNNPSRWSGGPSSQKPIL